MNNVIVGTYTTGYPTSTPVTPRITAAEATTGTSAESRVSRGLLPPSSPADLLHHSYPDHLYMAVRTLYRSHHLPCGNLFSSSTLFQLRYSPPAPQTPPPLSPLIPKPTDPPLEPIKLAPAPLRSPLHQRQLSDAKWPTGPPKWTTS